MAPTIAPPRLARRRCSNSCWHLRARQIPVYTIGVGSERFARDIEVSRVEVPGTVLREASILVEVVVAQRGYAGTKVPVVVEDSGRIIGSREVTLPQGWRSHGGAHPGAGE